MGEMGHASLMLQDEAVHGHLQGSLMFLDEAVHGHHQGSLMLLDEAVHGHLRHPKRKRRSLTPFPELGSGVFWLTYRCDFIDRELRALKKSKNLKIFVNKKIPLTNQKNSIDQPRMQLFFIAKFIEPGRNIPKKTGNGQCLPSIISITFRDLQVVNRDFVPCLQTFSSGRREIFRLQLVDFVFHSRFF